MSKMLKWAHIMGAPIRLPHDIYPVVSLITGPALEKIRPMLKGDPGRTFEHVSMYDCPTPEQWLFNCFAFHEEFLLHAKDLTFEQAVLVGEELSVRLEKIRLEALKETE